MGFLDTVIKDSGNEFASKVSDGVAAGDAALAERERGRRVRASRAAPHYRKAR